MSATERTLQSHAFDVQALQKSLEQARLDLDQLEGRDFESKLIAPFDGLITRVDIFPGDTIAAYRPVIFISDPSKLIISADIGEGDLHRLAVGQQVEIRMQDQFPDQLVLGKITLIPGQVRTQTGLIPDRSTKIDVPWPGPGVEIGMLARVKIILQKLENVLLVPQAAVRTVGKRQFVEYNDEINGQPVKRSRNVVPGLSSGGQTEIKEGVQEGMVILRRVLAGRLDQAANAGRCAAREIDNGALPAAAEGVLHAVDDPQADSQQLQPDAGDHCRSGDYRHADYQYPPVRRGDERRPPPPAARGAGGASTAQVEHHAPLVCAGPATPAAAASGAERWRRGPGRRR